jgi:PAS domain S-box-containing protein
MLFTAGEIGCWTFDVATYEIRWSAEQEALYGLEPGEFSGKPDDFLAMVVDEDREMVAKSFLKALDSKQYYDCQYRVICKGGKTKWINSRGTVEYENGKASTVIGVAIDITAQKEIEEKLHRAKEAAELANRAKSTFLANMSHEIRTPLSAILGFSELLKDPAFNREDHLNYLEIIQRNGVQLTSLIDDILDLSKVEAGHLQVEKRIIQLQKFLSDISTLFVIKAREKGISLTFDVKEVVPEAINSDPMRLKQVLTNIVGNAIKFTSTGAVKVIVDFDQGVRKLKFLIRDTGCGIPEGAKPKLFQPFSQSDSSTTRRFGGTGLGLVLSQKLARSLGGDVQLVESIIDQGSTFLITIDPGEGMEFYKNRLTRYFDSSKLPYTQTKTDTLLKGKRILLAEDLKDNQLLITRILISSGAEVDIVENGAEAVRTALAKPFDCILMDIQMPVMDGIEATKTLRRQNYRGSIIALTAHALVEERSKCLKAGCNYNLSKPVKLKHLIKTISAQIEKNAQ